MEYINELEIQQKVNFVVFEDSPSWQKLYTDEIRFCGYILIAQAANRVSANQILDQIRHGSLVVDIAIMDEHLEKDSVQDGKTIAVELKRLGIQVIAITSEPSDWGDVVIEKGNPFNLNEIVRNLRSL